MGLIPAHLDSKRLPQKVLLPLGEMSIIQRVYQQALRSDLDDVWVVTDSKEIDQHVKGFGGRCLLKGPHSNGTQRCVNAYLTENMSADILVNIQADEPFINPNDINALLRLIRQSNDPIIGTLAVHSNQEHQYKDPNVVKIAVDKLNKALYFSRSSIPFVREQHADKPPTFLKHKGVYAFHTSLIPQIASLTTSPLEQIEKLEQLTWLYNGMKIYIEISSHDSLGIDTLSDYEQAKTHVNE